MFPVHSVHIVVVEEEVIFDNPPGSNGEKKFYNVMKNAAICQWHHTVEYLGTGH